MRSVQQLRQRALSLFDRFSTEILPVEFEEIERTKGDSMIVLAPTYISKTAKPFSSQAMASPSTTHERAGRVAIASLANGKRLVKLYPLRVISRTPPASRRAMMRKPSCLISCSQPSPAGGSVAGAAGKARSGVGTGRGVGGAEAHAVLTLPVR